MTVVACNDIGLSPRLGSETFECTRGYCHMGSSPWCLGVVEVITLLSLLRALAAQVTPVAF